LKNFTANWNDMAVPVFDPGAEGKVLPWLGRSAVIFHSLRLLVVAVGKFPSALLVA